MKKAVITLILGLVLAGCGNAAQTSAEPESTVMQETVEESSEMEVASSESGETEETSGVEETQQESEEAVTEESAEVSTEEVVKEVTEEITVFEQPKTMYATIALNVRRGPSTEYEVVSHLSKAQAVEITGQAQTGWYQLMVDGTPAYASNNYLSETQVEVPAPTPQPAAEQTAQAPVVTAAPAPATAPAVTVAPAGVIMVGDSRCVQMQAAVGGGGCSWVCENSKEYTWFSEIAIPKFDQYVGNGTKVVINMGVNDPEHYNDYVALINAKAAEWAGRGARTYLVSVNPVWENPYTDQADVDTFNANVPGMLVGVTWIDTSSWLNANGYRLVDGLHYDDPTYVNIFNLIMGSL